MGLSPSADLDCVRTYRHNMRSLRVGDPPPPPDDDDDDDDALDHARRGGVALRRAGRPRAPRIRSVSRARRGVLIRMPRRASTHPTRTSAGPRGAVGGDAALLRTCRIPLARTAPASWKPSARAWAAALPDDSVYTAWSLTAPLQYICATTSPCGRVSFAQGACVGVPCGTAHRALFARCRAEPGDASSSTGLGRRRACGDNARA